MEENMKLIRVIFLNTSEDTDYLTYVAPFSCDPRVVMEMAAFTVGKKEVINQIFYIISEVPTKEIFQILVNKKISDSVFVDVFNEYSFAHHELGSRDTILLNDDEYCNYIRPTVDEILEKIKESGMDSLMPYELEILNSQ
jgi:hypothetical protein